MQRIANGRLPIITAYRYSSEEQVNAFIIKNLDGLRVDLADLGKRFGVNSAEQYGEVFRALQEFGLIDIRDGVLEVTDRVIFFVTAIKRCFYDADYVRRREEYYERKIASLATPEKSPK